MKDSKRKLFKRTGLLFIFLLAMIALLLMAGLGYRLYAQNQIAHKAAAITEQGGISKLEELEIDGSKQYILIEGQDLSKPVILFLHGGPGAPVPFGVSSRAVYPELTDNSVAVFWDQRGAGKSYHRDLNMNTMNVEQFVADANEVTDYVRETFNQDKIYLAGISFGTIIGTELAHRYPEKFHGYIAWAQLSNVIEGQKLAYEWLEGEAAEKQDDKTLQTLDELGQPPYFKEREQTLGDLINKYSGYNYKDEHVDKASIFGLIKPTLVSPDYTLADIYKTLVSGASFSIFEAEQLQEEIIKTDFFTSVPALQMPVYFIHGQHDKAANFELAKQYYEALDAPAGKEFIAFENAAHYMNEEDFERYLDIIIAIVNES